MSVGNGIFHAALIAGIVVCSVYDRSGWAIFFAICFLIAPSS